jgi:hypothetical protein
MPLTTDKFRKMAILVPGPYLFLLQKDANLEISIIKSKIE